MLLDDIMETGILILLLYTKLSSVLNLNLTKLLLKLNFSSSNSSIKKQIHLFNNLTIIFHHIFAFTINKKIK